MDADRLPRTLHKDQKCAAVVQGFSPTGGMSVIMSEEVGYF